MAYDFSDATISGVIVNIGDKDGRHASVSFENDGIVFHRGRPRQGRKATVPFSRLLDLAVEENPEFFDRRKPRRLL